MYSGTVLNVVQLAATSTADVTLAWFAAASIPNDMPSWAVASKMPLLSKMSETTGARSVLSDVVAGPANIVFRWPRTFRTGVDEVLLVL